MRTFTTTIRSGFRAIVAVVALTQFKWWLRAISPLEGPPPSQMIHLDSRAQMRPHSVLTALVFLFHLVQGDM